MMNVGNPEEAFRSVVHSQRRRRAWRAWSSSSARTSRSIRWRCCIPSDLDDAGVKAEIDRLTTGYTDKPQFFVDKLAEGVAMIAAAFYPKDVIVRL